MNNDARKVFKLEDYKGNYVMHCKTPEEAERFCRFLHQSGKKWSSGKSYISNNFFCTNRGGIVYCFNEGTFASYGSFQHISDWDDYVILECEDYHIE